MPANLTPEYYAADQRYREAKTREEKIEALEDMLSKIPKHKGTDHMQADIKKRLSKLRSQEGGKGGAKHYDPFYVPRTGAGQAALIGPPNCGKSSILAAMTKAKVNVTDYPFATTQAVPGMMHYQDIQIQLVDMPPITPEGAMPGMTGAYRQADLILVIVDLSAKDALEQMDISLSFLRSRRMIPVTDPEILTEHQTDVPEEGQPKKTLVIGTKSDLPGTEEVCEMLRELCREQVKILPFSRENQDSIQQLRNEIFRLLNVVRVYSKRPGHPAEMDEPFVLHRGSTVTDFAAAVHRDMAKTFRSARLWSQNGIEGMNIQRDHVLEDQDVVEIHT
jgi:ribosome-interacting GTPase 1